MIKFFKRLIGLIIFIVIVILSICVYQGYKLYEETLLETSITEKIEEIKNENPNYITFKDLPEDYINAVVATEDRRFFKHKGIDIISIGRAIVKNVQEKSLEEGGSTITQQLAKNTYFTQKKELSRKIAEMFMAFEYEKECTKEERNPPGSPIGVPTFTLSPLATIAFEGAPRFWAIGMATTAGTAATSIGALSESLFAAG